MDVNQQFLKRTIYSFLGVIIISLAVAVYRYVNLGTDPFTCFNTGISKVFHISFGNAQVIVSIILILIFIWSAIRYFGLGTIFSMFFVGHMSDYVLSLITYDASQIPFIVKIVFLAVALVVCSFGIALYSCADLGISPYDAVSFIIDEKSGGKLPFKYVRIVFDVLLVVIGYLMGGVVGIGTLMIAFGTGPIVDYLIDRVVAPYMIQREK